MEIILALCLGVTLSAASGFRLFVPPLALSLTALYGNLELSSGFQWVGHTPNGDRSGNCYSCRDTGLLYSRS